MVTLESRFAPNPSPTNAFLATPCPEFKIFTHRPVVAKTNRPIGKDRETLQDRTPFVLTNSSLLLSVEYSDAQISKKYDVTMRIEEIRSRLQHFDMYDIFSFVYPNPLDKEYLLSGKVDIQYYFQIVIDSDVRVFVRYLSALTKHTCWKIFLGRLNFSKSVANMTFVIR